jgi:hypothetical protein
MDEQMRHRVSLPSYDAEAAKLLTKRVLEFLDRV